MTDEPQGANDEWDAVLNGDREAFRQLVDPYVEELIDAARRDLEYQQAMGNLAPDRLTPEELVGETLVRAWQDRSRRPHEIRLRAWLLGLQHQVLQRLSQRFEQEEEFVAVSLEEPFLEESSRLYDNDTAFWEWYQPDDVTSWEDVIPEEKETIGPAPPFQREQTFHLPPDARQVLLLHDYHNLPLEEVAWTMGYPVDEAATVLRKARFEAQREEEESST